MFWWVVVGPLALVLILGLAAWVSGVITSARSRGVPHGKRVPATPRDGLAATPALTLGPYSVVVLTTRHAPRRDHGLKWSDLDLKRRLIQVQRSIWESHQTVPKGGKGRVVDMTSSLADALAKHRHLRGDRVLYADDGRELTNKIVRSWLSRALRAAGVKVTGAIHRPRHTFCSMLAAEGAPPLAIQELAGHGHITTTMKYRHLSPTTRGAAIALLDRAWDAALEGGRRGDIVDTEVRSEAKRNRSA